MSQPVIGVIFYSTYGHVAALAEAIIEGVKESGAIVKPYVIQETLSEEILTKMHAGSSLKPKYEIITPEKLKELDGFILGSPTRYGRVSAQVSAFIDQTGGLWATGALVGKFVSTFTSSAGQHGGQETTALTTMPFFAHQGLIYVPIGFTQPYISDLTEIHGTSAWGASTIAAPDGSRQPTEGELGVAKGQGAYFAKVVGQSVRGRHLIEADATTTTGTVAAKAAPADATDATTGAATTAPADGYDVGAPGSAAGPAADAVGVAGGAGAAGAVAADATATRTADAAAPAAAAPPVATDAPAATTTADPAVTPAATTAAAQPQPQEKKKSGGLFWCCSGKGIDQ